MSRKKLAAAAVPDSYIPPMLNMLNKMPQYYDLPSATVYKTAAEISKKG